MRLLSLMAALALTAAAAIAAGCGSRIDAPANVAAKGNSNAPATASATPSDNVRRVTISELRDMLEQNKAVVVDVRGTEAYKQEHIKGALDFPENQLSSRSGELPKDKLIVLYCS
jgi:outer membrane lipopolysaccharide assembly protein LptE/RlpB